MPDPAWFVIAGTLGGALVTLSLLAEFLERRYVRREVVRKEIVGRAHVHQWVQSLEPVDGVYVETCFCKAMQSVVAKEA